MVETIVALLMLVNNEIKEHRIQESMGVCLRGKRKDNIQKVSSTSVSGLKQNWKKT